MRRVTTRTASTSSEGAAPHSRAGISGQVLKVARESVGLSQEQFAERLTVDPSTVQSWETGRRPVTSIQLTTLARLRHALRQLGTNQEVLAALQDASEADYLLDYVFTTSPEHVAPESHPLGSWVMKRSVMDVLAWAVADQAPAWLSNLHRPPRRGPVADRPLLGTVYKQRFFDHLRIAADCALTSNWRTHPAAVLLRWQAYYLSAWSTNAQTQSWLRQVDRLEHGLIREPMRWTPSWAAIRSLVVARARLGDPEPLRWFIEKAISSDECQAANLNYWAYWVGETIATHYTGEFMVADRSDWGGTSLLHRLVNNLRPGDGAVDLYVHSLAALFQQRPYLVKHDPVLAKAVTDQTTSVLLQRTPLLSPASVAQLERIRFGAGLLSE